MKPKIQILFFILFFNLFFTNFIFGQGAPACASVNAGSDTTICAGTCITLNATLITNNQTTNYSVASIPYAPYSYTAGSAILVSTDDVWSTVENLGFNFCYFGNSYNQVVIGANGQISFDLTNASGYDNWQNTVPLPSTTDMPGNTISCPFRDIDPAIPAPGESVTFQMYGTTPCRAMVVSWNNTPLFDNTSTTSFDCGGAPNSTFQCVLYENTNYIDVYVENSFSCAVWNGGFGTIGIQNAAATVAVCPPGRNHTTFSVNGTPEAWRFSPTGPPSYSFNWFKVGSPASIGTTTSLTVCPTTNTSYASVMKLINCDGTTYTVTDTININVLPSSPPLILTVNPANSSICTGGNSVLTVSGGGATYTWSPAAGLSSTTGSSVTANPLLTTTYTVVSSGGTGICGSTGSAIATVIVNPLPTVAFSADTTKGCDPLCVKFKNLSTPRSQTADWLFGDGKTSNSVATASYCYPNAGTYTVKLIATDSLGCSNSMIASNLITVYPQPVASFSMTPQPATIVEPTVYFTDHSSGGVDQWEWNFGDVTSSSSSLQNPQYTYSDTGYYNVNLIVSNNKGCTDSISQIIYVEGDYTFYVPNAFTPNGDGLNDVFQPTGSYLNMNSYDLSIFDRWGNLIFHTNNFYQGWDGRANGGKVIAQEDVYAWKISIKDFKGNGHLYLGHVSLLK
ncbi:MAG: PKD domain-containing protein [Bacteroidia bacterium]